LLDQVIEKQLTTHVTNLRGVPPDRESMAEALTQLLEEIRRLDPSQALLRVLRAELIETPGALAYHLFLDHRATDGSEVRTGVVLAHDAGAKSTYHILSKLVEDLEPPSRVLILVSEDGVQVGEVVAGVDDQVRLQRGKPADPGDLSCLAGHQVEV
jgi:hypothetical protein